MIPVPPCQVGTYTAFDTATTPGQWKHAEAFLFPTLPDELSEGGRGRGSQRMMFLVVYSCLQLLCLAPGAYVGIRTTAVGFQRDCYPCLLLVLSMLISSQVKLNVYDLSPVNEFGHPVGLGVFHSGLEVDGREYTFAGGGGIFDHDPRKGAHFVVPIAQPLPFDVGRFHL